MQSCSHCSMEDIKGLFQKEHLLVCEPLRSNGSSGQYACGQNVDAKGALFAKIKYGNLDFCRPNTDLYSSSASAAQLFFIHNLTLFLLLFAFLRYIATCPRPTRLTCTAEESRIVCMSGEESHESPIENRNSQTIRS